MSSRQLPTFFYSSYILLDADTLNLLLFISNICLLQFVATTFKVAKHFLDIKAFFISLDSSRNVFLLP